MSYLTVYDGNCNLCVNLVRQMETLDRGERFRYAPMQDEATLRAYGITAADCELGMILLDLDAPEQRWQGSDAAEEITRILPPMGSAFVEAYRNIPGLKWLGDRLYEQIRDNRYGWFGQRSQTYHSTYPLHCQAARSSTNEA